MSNTYNKRDIFDIVNAIAVLDMRKIDAGDRHTLNQVEQVIYDASAFIEKLTLGDFLPDEYLKR